MTDREQLELAAKAAGVKELQFSSDMECPYNPLPENGNIYWNPLRCDGDALRLAVKLELDVMHRVVGGKRVEVLHAGGPLTQVFYEANGLSATRRAIVRAAAEIGKQMDTVDRPKTNTARTDARCGDSGA